MWGWLVPYVRVEVVCILCACRGTLFLCVEVFCTLCQYGDGWYPVLLQR